MTSPGVPTCIFPPPGNSDLAASDRVTAAFGPIHLGDSIELRWAPADTKPDVHFTGVDTNRMIASTRAASPLIYNVTLNNPRAGDPPSGLIAWFFFSDPIADTVTFNTVTFNYSFAPTGAPTHWRLDAQAVAALANLSKSNEAAGPATTHADGTAAPTTTAAITTSPDPNGLSAAGGLTPEAAAGIAAGVTATGIGLLVAVLMVLLRRRRRERTLTQRSAGKMASVTELAIKPSANAPPTIRQPWELPDRREPVEVHTAPSPIEVPEFRTPVDSKRQGRVYGKLI